MSEDTAVQASQGTNSAAKLKAIPAEVRAILPLAYVIYADEDLTPLSARSSQEYSVLELVMKPEASLLQRAELAKYVASRLGAMGVETTIKEASPTREAPFHEVIFRSDLSHLDQLREVAGELETVRDAAGLAPC